MNKFKNINNSAVEKDGGIEPQVGKSVQQNILIMFAGFLFFVILAIALLATALFFTTTKGQEILQDITSSGIDKTIEIA